LSFNFKVFSLIPPQFIFFGGKGGVGKTTCAAARAVASAGRGARVLVVSTDPAHSLGDALGVRLSSRPSAVRAGRTSFRAVELDAPRAFARFVADHRQALGDVVEHGTWLDRADADALLDLPIPGVDELVGMVEIVALAAGNRRTPAYDEVIVDTAPTGHTLRLLAAPDTVASVAEVLDVLQQDHRLIRDQLARVGRPEAADRLIALIAAQAADTGALLRDRARTAFEWVMLPEALSLAESADALTALDRARISVREIIVNRVIPDGPACPICDRRRDDERRVIARIPRVLGRRRTIRLLTAEVREPRGAAALARLGKHLAAPAARSSAAAPAASRSRHASRRSVLSQAKAGAYAAAESIDAFRGARLLFFGGKGGVGKTTVAAAAAVRLARADPARRVLLLSTDPAHSLADVFGVRVGDRPTLIRGASKNLYVRELDAPAALAARRLDLEAAVSQIMAAVHGREPGLASAERAVSRLMDLAPPGIDELLGMITVVDARDRYPLIVIDTAPTGHALRLLEMPDIARDWVQVLLRVLLKYRSLVRPGQLAAQLVELSRSIRALHDLVRDHDATRFIVVTRAAQLPRIETDRLVERLRRLALATPAIVVNALTMAPGRCARCRATASAERRELAALAVRCRRRHPRCVIIQTPLSAPPPRGVAALERWGRAWTAGTERQAAGKQRRPLR
jgi:arsenite/tail-anchored protein-transporting ATPase